MFSPQHHFTYLLIVCILNQNLWIMAMKSGTDVPKPKTKIQPLSSRTRGILQDTITDLYQYVPKETFSKPGLNCSEVEDASFSKSIHDDRVSMLFYDISLFIMYKGMDCTTLADAKIQELTTVFGEEIVADLFQGMLNEITTTTNATTATKLIDRKQIQTVINNVDKITAADTTLIQLESNGTQRLKRSSRCYDAAEEKAYSIIQWIPLVSFLYSLGTSIHYGRKGCHEVAKSRAIDMAIDLGTNLAVAVTGGAASAAVYGAKIAVKAGIKAGTKAFGSAVKAAVNAPVKIAITTAKQTVKTGIKTTLINTVNGNAKAVIETAKAIRHIPTTVVSGAKRFGQSAKKVVSSGIKEHVENLGKSVRKNSKSFVDHLADNAEKNIQKSKNIGSGSKKIESQIDDRFIPIPCRVRRMINDEDPCERILRAQYRALSNIRKNNVKNVFDEIKKSDDIEFVYRNPGGITKIDSKIFQVQDNGRSLKENFQILQHYFDNMDTGTKLFKKTGTDVYVPQPSLKALQVKLNIGGEPIDFALLPGRDRQIFIKFINPIDESVGHSYDDIVKLLDDGTPDMRRERAKLMLDSLNKNGASQTNWKSRFDIMDDKQREAARQLLVLTHVAESALPSTEDLAKSLSVTNIKPGSIQGGVGGMDKLSREVLRTIEQGDMTFFQAFNTNNGRFVIARQGGKKKVKTMIYRPSNPNKDIDQKQFNKLSGDMSSDSNRKRRAIPEY